MTASTWLQRPSPNHSPRPVAISAIILHADASAKIAPTLNWITKSQTELDALWEATPPSKRPATKYHAVSYHLVVDRDGTVYQCAPLDRIAWHAGAAILDGNPRVNSCSIGVALSNTNTGKEPYPEAQRAAAVAVCAHLCRTYGIPVERITTHALVATPPGRKTDPKGVDLVAFRQRVAQAL